VHHSTAELWRLAVLVNNFCFAFYCIRPHPRLPARPKPADQASSFFTTYLKNKGKSKENRRPLTHLPPSLSLLLRPALSSLRVPRSFFHFSLSSYILHTAELRPWHLLPARWSSSEYVLRLTESCFVVVLHQPTKPPLLPVIRASSCSPNLLSKFCRGKMVDDEHNWVVAHRFWKWAHGVD
jgi:hypothetical protein